jgi:cyanate permease
VNELLRRHGLRVLIVAAIALVAAGLWIRPDEGVDALPGFYALTGAAVVVVVVFAVRALHRILARAEDEYDAD